MRRNAEFYHQLPNDQKREVRMEPKIWPERLLCGQASTEADAEELHMIARAAMHKAGIRNRMLDRPVKVRFYWDDGLDCDNHAVLGKAFLDAMKGYILPDDNRKWVKMVSHEFWDGGAIKVEIMPGGRPYA